MGHSTFQVGDLSAVIGDNAAHEKHRAGYNGLWSLRHRASQRSLFVPGIAGLNYEHIFNGDPVGPREVFFEPRNAPMTFRKISDSEAELHQPATPTFHLESWTRFKLVAPHYIDMSFRCVPRQHASPPQLDRPVLGQLHQHPARQEHLLSRWRRGPIRTEILDAVLHAATQRRKHGSLPRRQNGVGFRSR